MSIEKNRNLMVEQIKRLRGQITEDKSYDATQTMYNSAIKIRKEIARLVKHYDSMKTSYDASVKNYAKNNLKEYKKIISKAFKGDKITSLGDKIRITFKDKYKYKFNNRVSTKAAQFGSVLNKIPKVGGKQPMQVTNSESNFSNDLRWVELGFTNQFLKVKPLPKRPF